MIAIISFLAWFLAKCGGLITYCYSYTWTYCIDMNQQTMLIIICSVGMDHSQAPFMAWNFKCKTTKIQDTYETRSCMDTNDWCITYEGDPRSNANSCVISFTIAIFQDSLHQNYNALSTFPDLIDILTESHSNPCCLATRECKVNDLGHG